MNPGRDVYPLWVLDSLFLTEFIDVAVKATLVMLAGLLIHASLRRTPAAWRHYLFVLIFASLLVLPLFKLALPDVRLSLFSDSSPTAIATADIENPTAERQITRINTNTVNPTAPSYVHVPADADTGLRPTDNTTGIPSYIHSWPFWIACCWGAGFIVTILPLALGILLNHQRVRRAQRLTEAAWQTVLAAAQQSLGMHRHIRLYQSREVSLPILCGLCRTSIVLPTSATEWPPDLRRHVLLHECAHAKRRDLGIYMMCRAICSWYWFHPLAWYSLVCMRAHREQATDDCVLNAGEIAQSYASNLLEIARIAHCKVTTSAGALAMSDLRQLEARIVSIIDSGRARQEVTHRTGRLSLAFLLLLVAGMAMLDPWHKKRASASDEQQDSKIAAAESTPTADEVIRMIRRLGGSVTQDDAGDVVEISFSQERIIDEDLRHFEVFDKLRRLNLGWTLVGDEGLAHISKITTLEDLYLEGCDRVTDDGMRHVAKLTNLTTLTIARTSVTDKGVASLTALNKLSWLDMRGISVTDGGVLGLTQLKNLQMLRLGGDVLALPSLVSAEAVEAFKRELPNCKVTHKPTRNPIADRLKAQQAEADREVEKEKMRRRIERGFVVSNTADAVAAIQSLPAPISKYVGERPSREDLLNHSGPGRIIEVGDYQEGDRVVFTDLDDYQLDDAFVAHLRFLADLEILDISRNPITDNSLKTLGELRQLRVLQLDGTNVTDAGLAHLSGLNHLHTLWLKGPLISDEGIRHLAVLTALEELKLNETRVTDEGLKYLAPLKNLKQLFLIRTQISDAGLAALKDLPNLQYVDVSGTSITEQGAKAFMEERPNCKVEMWLNARRR